MKKRNNNYLFLLATNLPSHRPYAFVMNKLVSTDCVYHKSDRYIAVHFSNSNVDVPPFLLERSYNLPSRFEGFLQHVLGIQSFFSNLFDKLVYRKVHFMAERKTKLKNLIIALNMTAHSGCNSATCTKVSSHLGRILIQPVLERIYDFELSSIRYDKEIFSFPFEIYKENY